MLDWLIIGGGMIGTSIANMLIHAYDVPPHKCRILDPHPRLLARWDRLTEKTGMQYLRSPWVHHIDVEHMSLRHFAGSDVGSRLGGFILPNNRPAYALFQAHTRHILTKRDLQSLHLRGSAEFMLSSKDGLKVETSAGVLRTKRVLLAIGRTGFNYPGWTVPLKQQGAPVQHIFEHDFSLDDVATGDNIVVLGGGITGGQVALYLSERQPGTVTLLMRHEIVQADFDSSPCWLGPKCSGIFRRTKDIDARRRLISEARNRGSMSSDIARRVREAVKSGVLNVVQAEVESATADDDSLQLALNTGSTLRTDRLLLATGFDLARPGGVWLDEVIEWFELPLGGCGFPIVDQQLCWHPGIYVSGPLAELELGPPAANIIGGQLAAKRLRTVN